jgi:formate hydrogenlyase subunit 6/NADH:ubiquinone oxidoreductase subunit I
VVRARQCIRCGQCAPACPVDAISQDHDGNVYICIHCGRCVEFCPHNCLQFEEIDPMQRSLNHD